MRAFHELIFERHMESDAVAFLQDAWSTPLGYVDRIKFTFVADIATGEMPTLTAMLYETPEPYINSVNVVKLLLNEAVLSTTDSTVVTASWSPSDSDYPFSKYLWMTVQLGGVSPKSHVRIWATGRTSARLPQEPPPPRTVADEIQRPRF